MNCRIGRDQGVIGSATFVEEMDQRRADALVDLVTGRAEPPRLALLVVVPADVLAGESDEPGWMAGVGPITAGTVRSISRKNVGFRRDGAMVAFRGLPEPPAGSGAVAANVQDPVSGVVMRVLMAYDARLGGVQITHEVLYGVKKLQEEKLLVIKA